MSKLTFNFSIQCHLVTRLLALGSSPCWGQKRLKQEGALPITGESCSYHRRAELFQETARQEALICTAVWLETVVTCTPAGHSSTSALVRSVHRWHV